MKIANAILISILILLTQTTADRQEGDSQIERISQFLVELIQQYDDSGSGAIPVKRYPQFLTKVFITGNQARGSKVSNDEVNDLLLEAATGFTTKYNTTEVGIQDFYMDLVKDFSIYLTQNQNKYQQVLSVYFSQSPKSQIKSQTKEQQDILQL